MPSSGGRRMIKKNKRGSQVEIVISFVIFMTFIFFIYLITQPMLKSERKESSLENLASRLAEKSLANITSASVAISATQDCVDLDNFLNVVGNGNRVIVRSDDGTVLSSGVSGSDLRVGRNGLSFFKVYGSGEFAQETRTISGCQYLTQGSGYTLGLVKTTKNIFESKIIGLIGEYNTDYDSLKSELKIPEENDFDFSFTYSNGTEILTGNQGQVPTSTINIYSRNIPIIYTSKQAGFESGLLNVKIW